MAGGPALLPAAGGPYRFGQGDPDGYGEPQPRAQSWPMVPEESADATSAIASLPLVMPAGMPGPVVEAAAARH